MMFMWLTIHNEKCIENKSTIPSLTLDVDPLYDPNALKFVPMAEFRSWLISPKGMVWLVLPW